MPGGDRNLTIAYAGAASLAAITLVYVFGPSFFIDSSNTSSTQRRNGVVGLINPANDCFINSVLQALAGLPELREYLIHRTRIANSQRIEGGSEKETESQRLLLSTALKSILDSLNEKPIHKKAISANPFLIELERIFRQKISRAQQDAQEFLQVVAERLAEEFRVMEKSLKETAQVEIPVIATPTTDAVDEAAVVFGGIPEKDQVEPEPKPKMDPSVEYFEDHGMPLEGAVESEIECQRCKYKTNPNRSKFVVLTLPVPVKPSAALSECFDGLLTTEYIDDYQCEKCQILHAIAHYEKKLQTPQPAHNEKDNRDILIRLRQALTSDPLTMPPDVGVPPGPRSRIAKRTRISNFPAVIVIHLSRSIYDLQTSSRKNGCKVSFPEILTLGGLLDRKGYKLQCAVTHKGGHDSGHYECFRRQIVYAPPFSTPHPPTANSSPSPGSSPAISVAPSGPITPVDTADGVSEPLGSSASLTIPSARGSESPSPTITHTPFGDNLSSSSSSQKIATSQSTAVAESIPPASSSPSPVPSKAKSSSSKKKVKKNNKWWRISDDKIRETKTDDVLSQQKEVYLLFYEKLKSEQD